MKTFIKEQVMQSTCQRKINELTPIVCTTSSTEYDNSSSVKQVKKNKTSREIRNSQTIQQAVLIGALNYYADIIFKQPAKKSITTHQYMRIKSVNFSDENVVSFAEFLKTRCYEHFRYDISHGVALKTAKRRYQTNKKTDGLHLLMDLLNELGFEFNTKLTEGKSGTIKLENILEVRKESFIIINQKNFETVGREINTLLNERMKHAGKEMTLSRNDPELSQIFRL
ncbi:hypothetical protein EDI_162850 [Entamoeba dispar SAW760]|uniref:Uncharacterized protein n=1 Tax=Entamoeba dispar (strain ATCC PRA-260 / SAW760) TaxID=370354 RepID=B0ECP6_ENTDS|nr:uncharacterized protein EDI_162850 [Entamoeba dispar SAW760]EDR27683.1 hypothetical protein EDI_162850 [Entamoeba dispar SAW760]|eukprot:EDR27683.1 hypothetical protein EDI_162850 [Entamoeba dispar SAW760]